VDTVDDRLGCDRRDHSGGCIPVRFNDRAKCAFARERFLYDAAAALIELPDTVGKA
jgi:hypothetical protein